MIRCQEIDDYIAYCNEHKAWINRKRWLLIENVVKPLMKREDIFFDDENYRNCLAFIEKNYYALFPYEKFIAAFIFMYKDDMPVFSKFYIKEGRGNGKDGFMVPIATYLMTPLYGVKNYNVELVANSESQIKDTYKVAYEMLNDNKKFKGKFKVTLELIKNLATGSEMKYNTANGKTKDGKRPGLVFLNEIHAYQNYDNISVYESGLGKVEHARTFIITTDGYERDGPLDDYDRLAQEILITGENPMGIFPFICELNDISQVDDPDAWHMANPSMEYLPTLANQIMKDYIEQQMLPSKRPEFIAKRMNLKTTKEEQAVTSWDNILRCCYEDIEKKTPREVPNTKGQLAIIGIDYADIRDFASAGVLTKTEQGEYIWIQHTWVCSQSPFFKDIKFPLANQGEPGFEDFTIVDAPVISIEEIVGWCERRTMEYQVVKIALDTYRYTLFETVFREHGISIETRDNPQGIVRLIRKIGSATGIIAPFMEALFAEGRMIYGASAIMRWYTNNTMTTTDKFGNKTFGKIEPKLRKNDGFMALMVAMFCKDLIEEVVIYV